MDIILSNTTFDFYKDGTLEIAIEYESEAGDIKCDTISSEDVMRLLRFLETNLKNNQEYQNEPRR